MGSSITFRKVELRAGNWKNTEAGTSHTLKLMAEMTRPAIRALGHEEIFYDETDNKSQKIKDSAVGIRAEGEVSIDTFRLEPTDLGGRHILEMPAETLWFEAYTVKANEEGHAPLGHISIHISMDGTFKPVDGFNLNAKLAKCSMKVKLKGDGQMKLGEEEEAEEKDGDEEAESATEEDVPLASAREMGVGRKKG